jgi:transcriptional regulator with XRE-family HTH domain
MSQSQAMTEPNEPESTLGEVIAEQRRRRHLTRSALAMRAGVSLSSVKNWELGHVTPSPSNLAALSEALGVEFIAGRDGEWQAHDAAPAQPPQVVVVVAGTAEAMREALDRLGVPRGE